MKTPILVFASALLASAALADSQPAPTASAPKADPFAALREPATRIAGTLFADPKGLTLLGDLSDSVGARVSGSAGHKHGAQWVVAPLKEIGVTNGKMC